MSAASVLVVEDDRFLQDNLVRLLRAEGFAANGVVSGEEALMTVESKAPDLVVLDLGLPGIDGMATCRRIRTKHTMPIIMLTARTDGMDKVMGLEVGADDYLCKPFEAMEFLARVRAQLRRAQNFQGAASSGSNEAIVELGDLKIDYNRRDVWVREKAAELTNREFEIVAYLAKNLDRAISRDQLFDHVWGYEMDFNTNSLDVYIYRIRKKIEADANKPKFLTTMRGYGYKLSSA